MPITVTVCVGSSCHIRGSRTLLKQFAEIIKTEHLENEVALVGSFCMEGCGETMSWKFDEEFLASGSLEEAEEALRLRLVRVRKKG